jgi:hypothetical protein
VVHAVSDAPSVNVSFNGQALVAGADFKQAATLRPNRGNYSVDVDALLPTGDELTVISVPNTRFDAGTRYDIIATGSVTGDDIEPVVLADDGQRDDPNSARLRVAHLSPAADSAAPAVSVFVTANGVDLPAEPAFSFAFRGSVGPLELDAGTYQIRVTAEGSTDVVYDSGPVELPAGSDLLIAAIDNTVYGESPVSLLVINGSDTSEILSAGTGADIRAVHNVSNLGAGNETPEATAVDVYVNAEPGTSDPATFSFGDTLPVDAFTGAYVIGGPGGEPGVYDIVVTASGSTEPAIEAALELVAGDLKTIVAVETAEGLGALAFADDNRRIATAAKLRLIHGAFAEVAQTVDVYLVPTAEGGAAETVIGNLAGSPTIPGFEFGSTTGYLQVPAGSYVAFITEGDNPANVLFKSPDLGLEVNKVYTAVARLALSSEEQIAGVTLLDDFIEMPR